MQMKLQASLEFLLTLSIIGVLIAGVIAIYGSSISHQKMLIGNLLKNESQPYTAEATNTSADFGYIIYMPLNSTIGSKSSMQVVFYGCSNGSASLSAVSNSIMLQTSTEKIQISNIGIANIAFEPIVSGVDTVQLKYTALCGGLHNGSITEATLASYPSFAFSATPAAYISNRSEKVAYHVGDTAELYGIKMWGHCTLYNFWYNPLPISVQCGTNNAWEYMMFSDYCYTTNQGPDSTTCIVPIGLGYNISTAEQYPSNYLYSIDLSLSVPNYTMSSALQSSISMSNITMNGMTVGNAHVAWISGSSIGGGMHIIQNGTSYAAANETYYETYIQAKENMYALLSYYNTTSISGSAQSMIQASIDAYINSVDKLISTRQGTGSCSVVGSSLECTPTQPLEYGIDADLILPIANTTADYDGSIINITGR